MSSPLSGANNPGAGLFGGSNTTSTSSALSSPFGGGGFAASPASSTSGFVSGGTLFGATNTTVASPSDAARGTKIPFGGFSGSTSTTFGSPAFESTTAASYDSPTVGNKRNKH